MLLAMLACSGSKSSDAGPGGGSGGSSGGGAIGGGSGGSGGAGGGGGSTGDDLCDFGGPRNCPAGFACTLALLPDAGLGKRCIAGACDLVAQDCDGGSKCAFLDGGRTCILDGTLTEGQSCAGAPVGCKRGLACTFLSSDGGSTCARFCRVDSDCGSPQKCYVTLVLPDTNERPLVCADPPMTCDPLQQDCVNPTEGCYPGSSGPGCFPAGMLQLGQSCTYSNDCAKGTACSGPSGATACRKLCAYDGGTPSCSAGGTCTRLVSSQTVGVCF
jgi:hypothetical protein